MCDSTPVTSVARCITFGRWSTNGSSGTLMDAQCSARADPTERTAYSCSSRSLEERARAPARARSAASSPVMRMVPASTREVTRPWSTRARSSGVAPTMPSTWNAQHMGYSAARRESSVRGSTGRSARASTARASTTLSRRPPRMPSTAAETAWVQASRSPDATVTASCGAGVEAPASASSTVTRASPSRVTTVSHARPSRRPSTKRGTTSAPPAGEESAKAKDPKATRPVP